MIWLTNSARAVKPNTSRRWAATATQQLRPQFNDTWSPLTCLALFYTKPRVGKKCFVRHHQRSPCQPITVPGRQAETVQRAQQSGHRGSARPFLLTLHHEPALRGPSHPRAGFVGGAHVDARMLHGEVRDHEVSRAQHLNPLHANRAAV